MLFQQYVITVEKGKHEETGEFFTNLRSQL